MRIVKKPEEGVREVFGECISTFRDLDLQKRLSLCTDAIESATRTFEERVKDNCTYTIPSHEDVEGIVTAKEMSTVYTQKLVAKTSTARKYYDKVLSAPKNGVCPLCGIRLATTLDHYLPKMKYPSLAVSLINLVPACKDCNTVKLDRVFKESREETLHPYYDNITSDKWLQVEIIHDKEISVRYYVEKTNQWTEELYERVKNHFHIFELERLYGVHAVQEVEEIAYKYARLLEKAGEDAVKLQLKEDMESYEYVEINSWKSALYRSLYTDEWFYKEWLPHQYILRKQE